MREVMLIRGMTREEVIRTAKAMVGDRRELFPEVVRVDGVTGSGPYLVLLLKEPAEHPNPDVKEPQEHIDRPYNRRRTDEMKWD